MSWKDYLNDLGRPKVITSILIRGGGEIRVGDFGDRSKTLEDAGRGHGPKNANSFWKLKKSGKRIFPQNFQEELALPKC